ncbi:Rtf2 RING-finger-domain-containing protein [Lipomyces japonicus]|uniref:Rtf2 RING-finger-domain-containing protein n=1 Tax=Lipomyces japonicus TaxID=56871 RepID=UPI0034CE4BAC
MGNDGGSIPTRGELVKQSAKERTTSERFEQNLLNAGFIWTTCLLSKNPLEQPVVSDCFGRLYNKDAVLEWLISPEKYGDGEYVAVHLKSLKDVVELKISVDSVTGKWICPVTFKEVKAGGGKFVYPAECGHVLADSAFREIEGDTCLECGTAIDRRNLVILNPITDEDKELLNARIARLGAERLTHSLKPASSKKKRKHGDETKDKKKKRDNHASIQDETTRQLAKKVMENVNNKMAGRAKDLVVKA